MTYALIIKNRATQNLRQAANYLLVNGTTGMAERFLESAETMFEQLAAAPAIGKIVRLVSPAMGELRQCQTLPEPYPAK